MTYETELSEHGQWKLTIGFTILALAAIWVTARLFSAEAGAIAAMLIVMAVWASFVWPAWMFAGKAWGNSFFWEGPEKTAYFSDWISLIAVVVVSSMLTVMAIYAGAWLYQNALLDIPYINHMSEIGAIPSKEVLFAETWNDSQKFGYGFIQMFVWGVIVSALWLFPVLFAGTVSVYSWLANVFATRERVKEQKAFEKANGSNITKIKTG